MAKLSIVAGATSQSVNVFIQDSSSTVGAGLSGLVFNSSGLNAYFTFTGTNTGSTQIVLATLAAVNSAYSSGGFKEIDATHMKGTYRLDLPNAVLAASKGREVTVYLYGATNMAPCVFDIELTGTDNQNATNGGMSAIPATPCTTNASLLTSGSGTDQLSVLAGKVLLQSTQVPINFTSLSIDSSGRVTLAPAGLDAVNVESGITASAALTNDSGTQLTSFNARQALALALSILGGVLAGASGTTPTAKPIGLPSGNTRYAPMIDSSDDRIAVNYVVPN